MSKPKADDKVPFHVSIERTQRDQFRDVAMVCGVSATSLFVAVVEAIGAHESPPKKGSIKLTDLVKAANARQVEQRDRTTAARRKAKAKAKAAK